MPGAGGKEVGRISIRVVPDLDGFREEVRAALAGIPDEKVNVDVDANTAGVKEKIEAAAKDADVKIKPKIDKSDFEKALLEAKVAAKDANVKLNVEFKDSEAEAKLGTLIAKLKAEAAAANIKLRVDAEHRGLFGGGGGGGGGGSLGGGGFGGGAGGYAGKLAMLGDGTLWIAGGVIALLAPAVALLSTALVSLPALITAVAAPLGVFALGIGGIKKALEDVGILSEGKKGKVGIGNVIKKIQEPLNDTFEKGFTPIFQSLVDAMSAPAFTNGLNFIARGIVNFATGITSALTSAPNLEMLNRMTNSIGSMLNNMTPGITSFGNGLIRLTTDVGDHLPGLGNWFTGLGDRFSNWITKIDQPGAHGEPSKLDSAVSGLKPVLDSVVNFVGQMMDSGIKMMADPAMAGNIKTVLDGIGNFIVGSLPTLNNFFTGLAGAMKTLGLAPDTPGGGKPGSPGQPGSPPGGGPKPNQIDPSRIPGMPNFSSGTPSDSNSHLRKGSWLDGLFSGFSDPFGNTTGRNPFKDDLDKLLNLARGGGLGKAMNDKSLGWLAGIFGGGKANADPTPPNAGPKAPAPPPGPAAPQGGQQAAQAGVEAQKAAGAVKSAFDSIPGALQGVWGAISAGAKGAFDGLVQAAQAAVKSVIAAIQTIPPAITAALAGVRAAGESAGRALGEGMAAGIAAGKGAAVAAAADLAASVEAAAKTHLQVKSPSRVFQGIGLNVSQGLGDGIDAGSGSAIDRARALAQQITDGMNDGLGGINSKATQQQIKDALAGLDVERDKLQAQRDALPKGKGSKGQRDALSGQLQDIKQIRDQLNLGRDQMKANGLDGKGTGSDSMTEAAQMITKGLASMLDAGKNFVMGNVQQFEHDLGIGGNGAIPTIANFGLGWAQQQVGHMIDGAFGQGGKKGKSSGGDTHYHVNSVDEAITADRTNRNQKALQWKGR